MYWNPAAEALTGFRAEEVVGRRCRDGILNHVDDEGRSLCKTRCPLLATIRDGVSHDVVAFLHHRDGHRVPVAVRSAPLRGPDGTITGAVEVFHDDSRSRALAERLDSAEHEALTDVLLGIANRRMVDRLLRQRHADLRRYGHPYALLFVDIDHFKHVNDRYGHDTGDKVLQLVASTLAGCIRGGDTVGRWGGEEFLVIAHAADGEEALRSAERARLLVESAWARSGTRRIAVTISVGVALARAGELTRDLVARADAAMLRAKDEGRNRSVLD